MAEVEKAIRKQFAKKVKAANLNLAAAQAGFEYAKANLQKRGAFYIERMDKTAGKIIIDGNSAAALGCMFAGCTVVTWYPITPSSSLVETMIEYMKEYRIGPDGKATFAIVQAEDELAAVGMVIGAGWAGARSMTATAGPGISLMSEFAGTGILRRGSGRDLGHSARRALHRPADAHFAGRHSFDGISLPRRHQAHHADSRAPWRSASRMATEAFNLAEQFQTLVFVMSDLDLGMNNWMSDPFQYPDDSDQARQGSEQGRSRPAWADSPATKTSTATASATARCLGHRIPRRRISRVAADTTKRRSTASARTTSKTTWSG